MKLILEYDDFCSHDPENCLDTLYEMIKEVPHIKFNLFTVPAMRGDDNSNEWVNSVQELIDNGNVQLSVHGLYHSFLEFENVTPFACKSYFNLINTYKEMYKVPWLPVFKGPNWGLNNITIEELISRGYTHIYNHEDHRHLEVLYLDKIKFVYYNQNLKDEIIPQDLIIAHGHTHNVCNNGIRETKDRVLKFVDKYKPEFMWTNEI